jgi:hypothetical protein
MIAYNRTGLDNMTIRKQAKEAFAAGCITDEENTKIGDSYPVNFYSPNIFICVGLFLLTIVIIACSLGLFLLSDMGNRGAFASLLIFFSLICYAALEYIVYKRRHFRSGVDYALLWMSAGLLYTGLYFAVNNLSGISQCITIFTIGLLFTLRFANNVMALLAYTALLAFTINIAAELNRTVQLVTPFIIMTVSVATGYLSDRFHDRKTYRHYRQCLTVIKAASLTSFYLAGNYFVVSELGSYVFGPSQEAGGGISMGWLFWILTLATPFLYIYRGIQKKDSIFLWTGLALIACSIFTIRYYYHLLPVEWAMLFGGIGIVAIVYGLIRYLRTARHGFTSLESSNKHLLENLHIESLVIAETFAASAEAPAAANDFQFGGGSGGGGGAGGQY